MAERRRRDDGDSAGTVPLSGMTRLWRMPAASGVTASRSRRRREALRLDLYLAGKEPGLSRAQIQRAVAEGRVQVNDRPAKAGRKVKAGDSVAIFIPAAQALRGPARGDPADDSLRGRIAPGDRQAGGDGRPSGRRPCRRDAGQRPSAPLPGPLGDRRRPAPRDRPPSRQGDLRTCWWWPNPTQAHRGLAGQFKRHEVRKTYQALVYGDPKTDGGRIEAAVGRHPTDRKRMSTQSRRGRSAVTVWRVRERFGVRRPAGGGYRNGPDPPDPGPSDGRSAIPSWGTGSTAAPGGSGPSAMPQSGPG